jgi:Fn3 associated
MRNWILFFLLIGLVCAVSVTGCQRAGDISRALEVVSRSPALEAVGQSQAQPLVLSFLFQIQYGEITKENFLTDYVEYGAGHTAGTPTITSLAWSDDGKTLTLQISEWSSVSTTTASVVHIVPRLEKIQDVFNNYLVNDSSLWKYSLSLSPSVPTAAAPVFSLAAGTYEVDSLSVTIESLTTGADIYYTTDGSDPNLASIKYSVPFNISISSNVRAKSVATGYQDSSVSSADYDLVWWQEVGGGIGSSVYGLGVGSLYVAGGFTDVGGGVVVNRVAKWDGSSWDDMDGGVNNTARAAVVDSSGNAYIGGDFVLAGPIMVNGIARWDGSNWHALNGGLGSGRVNAIAIDDADNVYIGGDFTTVDGVTVNRVAKWDGSTWSALGTGANVGVNNYVYSLYYDNTNDILYVGGYFSGAANATIPVKNIAAWDSNTNAWSALGDGFDSSVMAITAHGSTIYAGGAFTNSGATGVDRVGRWNGLNWLQVGNGVDGTINALVFDNSGTLFAGGSCTGMIQRFDGSSWSSVGGGIVGSGCPSVNGLVSDGSNVYAGGGFHTSGGVSTENIAVWGIK